MLQLPHDFQWLILHWKTVENNNLSQKRAEAVVSKLTGSYGIDGSRIIPKGVGMLAPKASNSTEDGRAKNRRVELVEK